jgi:hypothetical protein
MQKNRRFQKMSRQMERPASPAHEAPSMNGRASARDVAPEAPARPQAATYPIAEKAAAIIQSMVADEAQKEQAFMAARNARMGAVEAVASAMGIMETVGLTALQGGRLAFVAEGPGQPLPEGVEIVENLGD